MRFWGRVSVCLAMVVSTVLAGCDGTDDSGSDGAGKAADEGTGPAAPPRWQLTDPPTGFDEKPVARVHGSAYAVGDVVFAADLDGLTMYDGRTGRPRWDHGQHVDDEPSLDPHDFRLVNGSGPLYVDDDEATVYASTWTTGEDLERDATSLTAFDGATGDVRSSRPITVSSSSSEVVGVADDIVLLADGSLNDDYTIGSGFVLRGVGRTTGKEQWTREGFAPVGISGTTLVGFDYGDAADRSDPGTVAAIDMATGEDLWTAAASAQAPGEFDTLRIPYVGGQSVVVRVERDDRPEPTTVLLDAASGKAVTTHPWGVDDCVRQTAKIAACSASTKPPLFFDPATGETVEPLVKATGAKVTAVTDDACYVDDDDIGAVYAVGSGKRIAGGQRVLPGQLGNGYALTEGGNYWEIHRGR